MRTSLDSPRQGTTDPQGFRPLGGGRNAIAAGGAEPSPATPIPAAEVAHDFNNILSVILSCASELAGTGLDQRQRQGVEEILAAASRGAVLTRELIDRARSNTVPAIAPVDVGATVASISPLLKRTAGREVSIALETGPGLPRALCDPDDLEKALLNLAANARDAMPAGGELRIRAEIATVGASDPSLAPGWYVRIDVSDSGAGISPEVLRRVAEPYFSTKAGHGSGLGLPTVFRAARAAGGEVRISSMLGKGTTVTLMLRAARADGTPLALGAR